MKKPDFKKLVNTASKVLSKHSPEILIGAGIAGMASAIILAVKATPEAMEMIDDAKDKKVDEYLCKQDKVPDAEEMCQETKLTVVETVKAGWKPYIPAALAGVSGAACIIGGNRISANRNAALMAAYSISEATIKEYQEYKNKVVEEIGEKREQTIHDEVIKERVTEHPVQEQQVTYTGKGETLCYDVTCDRYFKSDIDAIRKAENILNKRLFEEMYISLNDYYYELGLKSTSLGNNIGWNVNEGMLDFHYTSMLNDNGDPCLVIDFGAAVPRYDYSKLL